MLLSIGFAEQIQLYRDMGCAPQEQKKKTPLAMRESPIGMLRVTVLGCDFTEQARPIVKPNLRVRVSNQVFKTQMISPTSTEQKTREVFTYAINSFFKPNGRTVEIGYFDGEALISFGSVDANQSIMQGKTEEHRCIMHFKGESQKQHGSVYVRLGFERQPFYELTFKFDQATIRRKTGHIGEDNVAARLTIGQEVHQTEHLPDSLHSVPEWADKKYNFKVPEGVKRGFLELVDDGNTAVGSAELNLDEYTQVTPGDEVFETQTLYHLQKGKKINAADLKYSFISGKYPDFKPKQSLNKSVLRSVLRTGNTSQSQISRAE